ncbi:MAG: hypothetical protein U9N51_12115 [Bacteroidota bacterium]|nr:hypothetical protein [Bacteroidota bacterium]
MKKICLFILLILFVISSLCLTCERGDFYNVGSYIYVYKTKNDYSENVPVMLSNDKAKIKSYPGLSDANNIRLKPEKLINGYYIVHIAQGINTGYLSLTWEEYSQYELPISTDSLYSLLIQKDPFIEYYTKYKDESFIVEHGCFGTDTAKINNIILNGELELYFERLK